MTSTCWDFLTIFHNKLRASCGRPQSVLPPFAETCSSSSSIPITQSPPSPLSLQAAAQLEVACPIFCVLRDEHHLPIVTCLSIFRLACQQLLLLALSAIPLLLYFWPPHHSLTSTGWSGPGSPTLWRVGVRLAHLLRHHRPNRSRSACGW